MTVQRRQITVTVCDGCSYELPARHTKLELAYSVGDKQRGKLVFHFHESSKEHDCLRYWMTGPGIMEHSLKEIDLLTDEARGLILKTAGGFRAKAA